MVPSQCVWTEELEEFSFFFFYFVKFNIQNIQVFMNINYNFYNTEEKELKYGFVSKTKEILYLQIIKCLSV